MNTLSDNAMRSTWARLLTRSAELHDRMRRVQVDLGREHEPVPREVPGAPVHVESVEVLRAVEEAARAEIARIDDTLERIEARKLAFCESCGEAIEPERLEVLPFAIECSHCVRRS